MTQFLTKLASAVTALALVVSFIPTAFAQEAGDPAPEVVTDLVVTTPEAPVTETQEEVPAQEEVENTDPETGEEISSNTSDTPSETEAVETAQTFENAALTDVDLLAVDRTTWYVSNGGSNTNDGSLARPLASIQDAISRATENDTIYVFSGYYIESAPGSVLSGGFGTHTFGLFFGTGKEGVTIVGLDSEGNVISDPTDANAPVISTRAENGFGPSGVFVDADNVTIQGVRIVDNVSSLHNYQNKTIEVVADNFTLRYSNIDVTDGGSVYINDFVGAGARVNSYTIEDNFFGQGASLDIASGAGADTPATDRVISGNEFDGNGAYWALVSFNGAGGVPWYTYPVGGAIITGNTFYDGEQYIRARGAYTENQFDWGAYFSENSFDNSALVTVGATDEVRSYSYTSGSYTFTNVRRIGSIISAEIANAVAGDTVRLGAGTYTSGITLDKGITLSGAGAGNTVIAPASGDGIYLTVSDARITDLTLDGSSTSNSRGIHFQAGVISGVGIENVEAFGWLTGVFINPGQSATVTNLWAHDNQVGLAADGPQSVVISESRFLDNALEGIGTSDYQSPVGATGLSVSRTSLVGNGTALAVYDLEAAGFAGGPVTASGNWWGSEAGPGVIAGVTIENWYVDAGLTRLNTDEEPSSGGGGNGSSGGGSRSSNGGSVAGGATGEGQVLGAATYNFSTDLTVGATGADVNALQQMLIDAGYLAIPAPTGYFGDLTRAALAKWQAANGVPATGYFGPLTREAIAAMTPATMTAEERAALIADLLEQVKELQEQLAAMEDAA